MSIACPHCRHVITPKGAKPGRFTPTCPKCGKAFLLTIPAEAGKPMTAAPLPTRAPAAAATDPNVSAPPPSSAPTEATAEWQSSATAPPQPAAEVPPPPAAKKTVRKASAKSAELPPGVPPMLGGYQILEQLGQGGMGTVYLARQLSLDRKVALKTMKAEWASIPRFLTRFTREAYAAAQLVHHNVVQIYDIGEDHGIPFFSMEFVPGTNLAQLVQQQGKLDVETAVGYVLQAARGLKFAHDQGMVHRDVKPDNLMVNDQGIVKVADLGLVKTPDAAAAEDAAAEGRPAADQPANVTAAGIAIGTPAYMAPEQGTNASGVDPRADIYSLGCTLYVLLTGRPPFQGKTALEVITKHLTEPVVRPDVLDQRVPPEIADILMKMLAKKPAERYPDLAAVIRDLEKFLGVSAAGPFAPREEHARALEEAAKQFHAAPAARLRSRAIPVFFAACAALVLLSLLFGWVKVAMGFLALALLSELFGFVLTGLTHRSHVFLEVRELVFDSTWADWLTWAAGLLLLLAVLWLAGLLPIMVGAAALAAGIVGVYHVLIDRKLAAQRHEPLEKVEQLLKALRLRGVDEAALQQFVCRDSGHHWEEFYETLFGYEALLEARALWGKSGTSRRRPHYAAWRDPLVRWLEARQKARKAARERKHLAKLEAQALRARGVSAAEARERAEQAAEVIVNQAAVFKAEAHKAQAEAVRIDVPQTPTMAVEQAPARVTARLLTEPTYEVAGSAPPRPRRQPLRNLLRTVLSPQVRFLAGAVLVGLCLGWVQTNQLLSVAEVANLAEEGWTGETMSTWARFRSRVEVAKPLPFLPAQVFNSFNPGIAGLLLILAALTSHLRVVSLSLAGAVVILIGPLVPLPSWVPVEPAYLWGIAGGAVFVLGLVLGRFVR